MVWKWNNIYNVFMVGITSTRAASAIKYKGIMFLGILIYKNALYIINPEKSSSYAFAKVMLP